MINQSSRPELGVIIEYVHDVEAATRFYVEVLGLEVERQHPKFVQFKEAAGARFAIASDEPLAGGSEREIYWTIDDAEASYERLKGQVEIVRQLSAMPFGKVFGVKGPAGKPQFLLEPATSRPSAEVE